MAMFTNKSLPFRDSYSNIYKLKVLMIDFKKPRGKEISRNRDKIRSIMNWSFLTRGGEYMGVHYSIYFFFSFS